MRGVVILKFDQDIFEEIMILVIILWHSKDFLLHGRCLDFQSLC